MRRIIIAAGVLMLLAVPAWAEHHAIEAKGWDVENTTTTKVLHSAPGIGFTGDVHWDVDFDDNGAVTLSEVAYAHDKYPSNGIPTYKARFNIETNETTIGKQLCLEYTGCAQADGDTEFNCNRSTAIPPTGMLIYTLPVSGNNYAISLETALGTTDTLTHANTAHTPCTLSVGSDCAFAKVRYQIRVNNNLIGCVNPSIPANGISWRITWMDTYTQ